MDKEESDKLGSKCGSVGTFGTGLGGLLRGIGFTVGVTLSAYESYNGDRSSLDLSNKNIGETDTGGDVCAKCTGNINIFIVSQISAES